MRLERITDINKLFKIPQRNDIALNANQLQFNEFQSSAYFNSTNMFRGTVVCLKCHLIHLNKHSRKFCANFHFQNCAMGAGHSISFELEWWRAT